jgi:ABC-type amino acid transport substrate-binding protein
LVSLFFAATAWTAPIVVIYPGSSGLAVDKLNNYYIALLDLALSKTGIDYQLENYKHKMVRARLWEQLEANEGVSVDWGTITPEIERRMLPIRIPLDRGILGWRLFLINSRDRQVFDNIRTLDQLKSLTAGQQVDWPDTAILRSNGLPVTGVADFDNLYSMLAAGRFNYFPRGIGEIWNEHKNHASLGLEVEQHLALHYPAISYFFVSRKNPDLAHWIEQGLVVAIKDGSFDKLFEQYNGEAIKKADLAGRTVFELNNPVMPIEAPQRLDRLQPR